MIRRTRRRWSKCVRCGILVFSEPNSTGLHVCPEKVVVETEAELDARMDDEMSTWDFDVKLFWKSKDVRFMKYLAEEGKI